MTNHDHDLVEIQVGDTTIRVPREPRRRTHGSMTEPAGRDHRVQLHADLRGQFGWRCLTCGQCSVVELSAEDSPALTVHELEAEAVEHVEKMRAWWNDCGHEVER